MLNVKDQTRLDQLFQSMQEANDCLLGYPFSKEFDYEPLRHFLKLSGNNVGDPFNNESYRVDSRQFEREVIEFFALLFNTEPDNYWGYVTNGGTEGNIYGLYLAREQYPDGIVYFSQDTHYSVNKAVHLLGLRHIIIKANLTGEMDYEDFRQQVQAHCHHPAIVVANIGTTMKEAKDDLKCIRSILNEEGIEKVYLHCDAAFCGPFAPFLEPKPAFDFKEGADSITISGHKFIGAPMPCGVVVSLKHHVNHLNKFISCISAHDTTLSGSRNAFTPIMLWYAIKSLGREGIQHRLVACQQLAAYAVDELNRRGVSAWRNPGALTVILPKVEEAIKMKWQLATEEVSHLVIVPGVTKKLINQLIDDITPQLLAPM